MSEMIRCDKCKKMMFTDSRSPKGSYCKFAEHYEGGYRTFHLCKKCLQKFWVDFMGDMTLGEFDDNYGAVEEDEPVTGGCGWVD